MTNPVDMTASKKPRVSNERLLDLIQQCEKQTHTSAGPDVLLALQELSNRRAADNCKVPKPVPMPGISP